jgi:hypothetical protein
MKVRSMLSAAVLVLPLALIVLSFCPPGFCPLGCAEFACAKCGAPSRIIVERQWVRVDGTQSATRTLECRRCDYQWRYDFDLTLPFKVSSAAAPAR